MRDKYQRIKIPVYIYAGWWDYFTGPTLKYYKLMWELGHTPEIYVWIDNTGHSQMPISEYIRWLDWVLKGADNGMKNQPPVRIFLQGANEERFYSQWPPAGTRPVKYYFHSLEGSRWICCLLAMTRRHGTRTIRATPSSASGEMPIIVA